MARANDDSSDDELPALSDILSRRRNANTVAQPAPNPLGHDNPLTARPILRAGPVKDTVKLRSEPAARPHPRNAKSTPTAPRRQRLLKSAFVDSRLARPVTAETIGSIAPLDEDDHFFRRPLPIAKRTPARAARKTPGYHMDQGPAKSGMMQADSDCKLESEPDEDVEGSLWSASHSDPDDASAEDDHVEAARQLKPPSLNPGKINACSTAASDSVSLRGLESESSVPAYEAQCTRTLVVPPVLRKPQISAAESERPSSSSSADVDAFLRYSPPRRKSPHKILRDTNRPFTPPLVESPDKPLLASPSKKSRIPTPPHQPSQDAFWSAEAVNTWNDLHSPRKVLPSPQKQSIGFSSNDPTCQSSPQKKSPAKKDPARREFEQRKHQLAEGFLDELDATITKGEISSLAAESGGVKLVWSKTLNTTAGRANWKKESIKVQENGISSVRHRHHASIELAEKVIDDEDRLINVVAHEFCHLANFMISNVRDNPHGKEFKEWAKKVTRAFSHRNVNVTTKHTYAIDYKYVWTCVSCGNEFKRHSKSIDPTKHRCGSCKSEIVQTKPAVRRKNPDKGPSEYQVFMKENFQRIKRENEGKSHKDIMEILGREYKDAKTKGRGLVGVEAVLRGVTRAIEVVTLDE